jgi:hypothetical protein
MTAAMTRLLDYIDAVDCFQLNMYGGYLARCPENETVQLAYEAYMNDKQLSHYGIKIDGYSDEG